MLPEANKVCFLAVSRNVCCTLREDKGESRVVVFILDWQLKTDRVGQCGLCLELEVSIPILPSKI